jgi:Protein of unknown function (DUF1583)
MPKPNPQVPTVPGNVPSIVVASLGILLYANSPILLPEATAQSNLKAEYHHAFKGNAGKREGFEFFGARAKHYVRFDLDGLRLTLPIGGEEKRPTAGVSTDIGVTGDFEITVAFEVLDEPAPEGGPDKQTRFTVDIVLDKAGLNAASLSRTVYGKGVEYVTWSGLQAEASAKPQTKMHYLPAKGKSGSLRLVRTRSSLSYYASQEAGEDFTLLQQYPFGTEDLKTVRLVCTTGAANAALDVRVTDLRIRAEALSNLPPAPEVQTPQESRRSFLWLLTALLVLLMATIGGLVLWFLVKRNKVGRRSEA